MDFATIDRRLLSYPGATKVFHEKWGWMVYWVGGRQFACEFMASSDAKLPYTGRHLLSFKCDPDRILELRAEYPAAILPGYYSDGRLWIELEMSTHLGGVSIGVFCIALPSPHLLFLSSLPLGASGECVRPFFGS